MILLLYGSISSSNKILLSKMLKISRSKTYELVCSSECPFLELKIGRRICILENSFLKWYNSLAEDGSTEDVKSEE